MIVTTAVLLAFTVVLMIAIAIVLRLLTFMIAWIVGLRSGRTQRRHLAIQQAKRNHKRTWIDMRI
jgi:hypothetical protein